MLAMQEQIERNATLQNALASQRMEGLEPDAKMIEDAKKWARGDMTIDAAIADFKARFIQDRAGSTLVIGRAKFVR